MKPSTILKKARTLIEKGWCRDTGAKDSRGKVVSWQEPSAHRFCSIGAVFKACGTDKGEGPQSAKHFLHQAIGDSFIATWNDEQKSKRPVLAAFDRAIKLAISEGR